MSPRDAGVRRCHRHCVQSAQEKGLTCVHRPRQVYVTRGPEFRCMSGACRQIFTHASPCRWSLPQLLAPSPVYLNLAPPGSDPSACL